MRLFRRHRPEPATEPAPAPEPDVPARAVQVVTGPPPLRTPEPASASPPPAAASPAATAPEPPAAPVAAPRVAESPKPMQHWHLATADMRVPASSATSRRT